MIKTTHSLSLVLLTCSSAFAMQQESASAQAASNQALPDTETLLRYNRPEYQFMRTCLLSTPAPEAKTDEEKRQREYADQVYGSIVVRLGMGGSFEQVGNHWPLLFRDILLGNLPTPDAKGMVRLSHADLRGIHFLPLVCGYKNLKQLKFIHNGISEIPPGIKMLTGLEVLYLSWNRITTLPPEMAELPNLRTLVLYRNRIKAVSRATLPPNLKVLDLSRNEIATFSGKDVSPGLTDLVLDRNGMETAPVDMDRLPVLEFLGLDHNKIETIELTNLPASRACEVSLVGNDIAALSSTIVIRTGLCVLDLEQNSIVYETEAMEQVRDWLPGCHVYPVRGVAPDFSEDY